jgi:two-component system, NtrC family, response regulator GlrR
MKSFRAARRDALAKFERDYLLRLLKRSRGNLARAARLAGVNRSTIYRAVQRLALREIRA